MTVSALPEPSKHTMGGGEAAHFLVWEGLNNNPAPGRYVELLDLLEIFIFAPPGSHLFPRGEAGAHSGVPAPAFSSFPRLPALRSGGKSEPLSLARHRRQDAGSPPLLLCKVL